jgi:hypothetical protein
VCFDAAMNLGTIYTDNCVCMHESLKCADGSSDDRIFSLCWWNMRPFAVANMKILCFSLFVLSRGCYECFGTSMNNLKAYTYKGVFMLMSFIKVLT